ncbi:MAG: HRDC domain-containing protein, partial [Planctomycetota bacterium]
AKERLRRARGSHRSKQHQQAHLGDLIDDDEGDPAELLTDNLSEDAFQTRSNDAPLTPEDLRTVDVPVVPGRRDRPSKDQPGEQPQRHRLTPRRKAKLITDDAGLADLCQRLARPLPEMNDRAVFAYDSEFIGEHTYLPKLCLIQVASPKLVAFIDPLAGVDLKPFWELMGDPNIVKIVHAGDQDLVPAVRAGVTPQAIFDTQIVAGFCALPYPSALAKLVEYICGEKLPKGLTFSQWDERPLSKKQLRYAADDVRHLPRVMVALERRLAKKTGLTSWALAECQEQSRPDVLVKDDEPWNRVKGDGNLDGKALAILRKLALWRDKVARTNDLPVRTLMRDEVITSLSRRPPRDMERLGNTRHMSRPVFEQYGEKIMKVIEEGKHADPVQPRDQHDEPTLKDKFRTDATWAVVQAICHCKGLDPNLVVSRREVDTLLRRITGGQKFDDHPLLNGWRRQAVGDELLALLGGDPVGLKWPGSASQSKTVG